MATSKLIQWLPEILQATDEDILRFGPNAAQVRALLKFIPGMSAGAVDAANDATGFYTGRSARDVARSAAGRVAANAERGAAGRVAANAAWAAAGTPARDAAKAEIVGDILDPQTYRILTDPLNVGRVVDLRAPEAGSEFMRLVYELGPKSADDIERLADLSVDPQSQGIIQLLLGLQGGMPLAAKIDAARRLDRVSRMGRRLS